MPEVLLRAASRRVGGRPAAAYDEVMNPRHRRLVIPVALGALILIVVLAALL
jgi:hypothetical protein